MVPELAFDLVSMSSLAALYPLFLCWKGLSATHERVYPLPQ